MAFRRKLILIVAGGFIILGISMVLLRPRRQPTATLAVPAGVLTPAPNVGLAPASGIVPATPTGTPLAPPPSPSAEIAVRQLSATFAERYGSSSSEGAFRNITDLLPLMTERYARAADVQVMRDRTQDRSASFRATTTVVLRADIELPGGERSTQATARVLTQRTEVRAGAAPQTTTPTLVLELLKTSEGWRVDRARWQ